MGTYDARARTHARTHACRLPAHARTHGRARARRSEYTTRPHAPEQQVHGLRHQQPVNAAVRQRGVVGAYNQAGHGGNHHVVVVGCAAGFARGGGRPSHVGLIRRARRRRRCARWSLRAVGAGGGHAIRYISEWMMCRGLVGWLVVWSIHLLPVWLVGHAHARPHSCFVREGCVWHVCTHTRGTPALETTQWQTGTRTQRRTPSALSLRTASLCTYAMNEQCTPHVTWLGDNSARFTRHLHDACATSQQI